MNESRCYLCGDRTREHVNKKRICRQCAWLYLGLQTDEQMVEDEQKKQAVLPLLEPSR